MTYLKPLFMLLGRAAVFWIGLAILAGLSLVLAGLGRPDEITAPYVNVALLGAFAFPFAAGWLAGGVVQELQHTSFAWALPSAGRRLGGGFLVTGAGVAALAAGFASQAASANNHPLVYLAVGFSGFCLAGLPSASRSWLSSLGLLAIVLLAARSRYLSEVAAQHPVATVVAAVAVGALSISLLFSRSTFRRKPFSLVAPFPGSYSVERSARYERANLARSTTRSSEWTEDYLGSDLWRWARAVIHGSWGPLGWRTVPKMLEKAWALGLLFAIFAWVDQGELGFWESLARTIHECVVHSPHVPRFGDLGAGRGPHPLVPLFIGGAGAALALWSPAGLETSLVYPLSRRSLARVAWRAGLIDSALFFAAVTTALTLLGLAAGWAAGYPARADFMPFFLRTLLGTLVLMPLASWGRVHLRLALQRKTADALVWIILGMIGFVLLVLTWSYQLPKLVPSDGWELAVSLALLALSQAALRRKLVRFYAENDLA